MLAVGVGSGCHLKKAGIGGSPTETSGSYATWFHPQILFPVLPEETLYNHCFSFCEMNWRADICLLSRDQRKEYKAFLSNKWLTICRSSNTVSQRWESQSPPAPTPMHFSLGSMVFYGHEAFCHLGQFWPQSASGSPLQMQRLKHFSNKLQGSSVVGVSNIQHTGLVATAAGVMVLAWASTQEVNTATTTHLACCKISGFQLLWVTKIDSSWQWDKEGKQWWHWPPRGWPHTTGPREAL